MSSAGKWIDDNTVQDYDWSFTDKLKSQKEFIDYMFENNPSFPNRDQYLDLLKSVKSFLEAGISEEELVFKKLHYKEYLKNKK